MLIENRRNDMKKGIITAEDFDTLMRGKLGESFDRANLVFTNFGRKLSYDVTNVLLYAADQGPNKVDEVLLILEEHWDNCLSLQHPDLRGSVHDSLGVNKTEVMFIKLCRETLGLTPVAVSGAAN
jgi:hypothetical protein